MDVSNKKNTDHKQMHVDPKVVGTVIVAVAVVLLLVYVIYSVVVKEDTFLIEKISFPNETVQQEILQIETQRTLETGELQDIENALSQNKKLKELKEANGRIKGSSKIGNPNPFKPFDVEARLISPDVETLKDTPVQPKVNVPQRGQIENRIPRFNQ